MSKRRRRRGIGIMQKLRNTEKATESLLACKEPVRFGNLGPSSDLECPAQPRGNDFIVLAALGQVITFVSEETNIASYLWFCRLSGRLPRTGFGVMLIYFSQRLHLCLYLPYPGTLGSGDTAYVLQRSRLLSSNVQFNFLIFIFLFISRVIQSGFTVY